MNCCAGKTLVWISAYCSSVPIIDINYILFSSQDPFQNDTLYPHVSVSCAQLGFTWFFIHAWLSSYIVLSFTSTLFKTFPLKYSLLCSITQSNILSFCGWRWYRIGYFLLTHDTVHPQTSNKYPVIDFLFKIIFAQSALEYPKSCSFSKYLL